jgi:tryptophan-rich sensory protein
MVCIQQLIIFMVIPILISFLISKKCVIGNAGSQITFRPPPIVFQVVWTTLYIFMGYSWIKSRNDKNLPRQTIDLLFIALNISLYLWSYFYGCNNNKTAALFTIPISMVITTLIIMINKSFLLVPLLFWLLVALLLNYTDVLIDDGLLK